MKNRLWISFNLISLAVFIYIYVGIFACGELPFYGSSSSFIFSCGFGYFVLLLNFGVFWSVLTIGGSIYYWRKGRVKNTLKISFAFLVLGMLMYFSMPMYKKVSDEIKEKRQEKLETINLQKQLNTPGNYGLRRCEDTLDTSGTIKLNCGINVNLPGKYIIKGRLFVEDPRLTGRDEVILETHPNKYMLNESSTVELSFEYRHVAKSKIVPDGPYVIELNIIPTKNVSQQVKSFTFSGFKNIANIENYVYKGDLITGYYSGNVFERLPYKKDLTIL